MYRTRGIPSHLLGAQPNGRQEVPLNDTEYNSSDTSVEDSKIQFQNNLRKFKAKCDNELEKLLEKCESRRKGVHDRKYFGGSVGADSSLGASSRLMMGSGGSGDLTARNIRRFDSANNNNNLNNNNLNNSNNINSSSNNNFTSKDDDENGCSGGGGVWIRATVIYDNDNGLLI